MPEKYYKKDYTTKNPQSKFSRYVSKEEEKKRKLNAEMEAAAVYKDYVEAFIEDEPLKVKKFVRAKQSIAPSNVDETIKVEENNIQNEDNMDDVDSNSKDITSNIELYNSIKQYKTELEKIASSRYISDKKKEKSNLEMIRDEIVSKKGFDSKTSSISDINLSTNLYVGNLNVKVTEAELANLFIRFGDIAQLRIVIPKIITADPQQASNFTLTNYGFVAFMSRLAAENALKEMNGFEYMDFALSLNWGNPIPILPQVPMYTNFSLFTNSINIGQHLLPNTAPFDSSSYQKGFHRNINYQQIVIPEKNVRCVIHSTIENVVMYGPNFELFLIAQQFLNPMYKFLTDFQSTEHFYYRWRLFSIVKGETINHWSNDNLSLLDDFSINITPPTLNISSLISVFERSEEFITRSKNLPKKYEQKLNHLLKKLDGTRGSIAKAMVWCIRNADHADAIIDYILIAGIFSESSNNSQKIYCLYLINDILFNSSEGISKLGDFRKRVENVALVLFVYLRFLYFSCETTSKTEFIRKAVFNCLTCWQEWALYNPLFLMNLRNIFLGVDKAYVKLTNSSQTSLQHMFSINNNLINAEQIHQLLYTENNNTVEDQLDGKPFDAETIHNFKSQIEQLHLIKFD